MTISRRLTLSFFTILVLFALNAFIQAWNNERRRATIEELRRAISRQGLVATISQDVNDIQKQVALLSQVAVEAAATGATPEENAQFGQRLDVIARNIKQLDKLAPTDARTKVDEAGKLFGDLSGSWRIFYASFGVEQSKAITELALRADPLSQRFIHQILPQLREEENQRVEAASRNNEQVARATMNIGAAMMLLSGFTAIVVAFRVSRYINGELGKLSDGVRRIGSGDLEHRIQTASRDELGALAGSFNEMTGRLLTARGALTAANKELESRHEEIKKQQALSESLLLNLLPAQVAEELRRNNVVQPRYFEDVTILFTDFVGFSLSTEHLAAEELVDRLNGYFTDFDHIVTRYGIEKLKTIGDSYMCVAGLPARSPSHPVDMVLAAFEMVEAVKQRQRLSPVAPWKVRVGVHTGPVIAGVVGIRKFAFDIWGDSVNYASRMESSGAPNRVNVSDRTYWRIKDFISCEHRGRVLTKDKKDVDMYFANGLLPALAGDGIASPPPAFLKRYHVYFQKDPPAFPDFLLREPAEVGQ
jgi:class 3 adenylate cyclase/HAMP domain-containing protein